MLAEVGHQLCGDGAAIQTGGLFRIVAIRAHQPGFIFDLYHNHRAVRVIDAANVFHYRPESPRIGVASRLAQRRNDPHLLTPRPDHAPVRGAVALHPVRGVIHVAVLPGGEPQEHQTQVVPASARHDFVDEVEVKLSRLRLDQLPIKGHFRRVRMNPHHGLPERFKILRAAGARVVCLAPQHQKRLAIHQKTILIPRPLDARNGPCALG